ncbi:hypothetical protein WJX73_006149 [Symbiochloris irregularis]|uniref:Uncharacterized protein n=1 Tax=Symbiochloris irregularis TaxID=706552 RepID=A0AAW1NX09_9CHLO
MKRQERSPSPMPVVPRRPRSVLRTRAGDAWYEAAKRPRLGNGQAAPGRRQSSQAAALDLESDRELDVAEALFDLANVAVAFSEQPEDSDEAQLPHGRSPDGSFQRDNRNRRQPASGRRYSSDDPSPQAARTKPHHPQAAAQASRGFSRHPKQLAASTTSHRGRGRPSYASGAALRDGSMDEQPSTAGPVAVKANRPIAGVELEQGRSLAGMESNSGQPSRSNAGISNAGGIAAFFPSSNLRGGPFTEAGAMGLPGHVEGEGDAHTSAGAGSMLRRPLKHCALHVYIAQFIHHHTHRSKAKEEDLNRAGGFPYPHLTHNQTANTFPNGYNPQAAGMSQSSLLALAHHHHQQQQQQQAAFGAGMAGNPAGQHPAASRMMATAALTAALGGAGPHQYASLMNSHGLPLMQAPGPGFPFLAGMPGGHLGNSAQHPFAHHPPPHALPPGVTPQHMASIAAMQGLFPPPGAPPPGLPLSLAAAFQQSGALGVSGPLPVGAGALGFRAQGMERQLLPKVEVQQPQLEVQGEHSPRADTANHMHEHNNANSNSSNPGAPQRSSMPSNATANNLKGDPDASNHGDSANGNHKIVIGNGTTPNGVHSNKAPLPIKSLWAFPQA